MSSWKQLSLGLIALNFVSALAYAGNEGSGGGNALVCFNSKSVAAEIKADKALGGGYIDDRHIPHIISVELLDIHKAQIGSLDAEGQIFYPKIFNSLPGETVSGYQKRLISRIDDLLPSLANYLKGPLTQLPVKVFPQGIAPIDDIVSGEMFPVNCVRSTIIAQFTENINDIKDCERNEEGDYKPDHKDACFAFKTYIAVDQRIYNLSEQIFPVSSRLLSFWHENFYYLARLYKKASRSDSVQSLIGALITEGTNLKDLLNTMKLTFGNTYEYDNFIGPNIPYSPYTSNFYALYYNKMIENLMAEKEIGNINVSFKANLSMTEKQIEDLWLETIKPVKQQIIKIYMEKYRPGLFSIKGIPKETLQKFDSYLQNHWFTEDAYDYRRMFCNRRSKFSNETVCFRKVRYRNPKDFSSFIQKLPMNEQFDLQDVILPNADKLK